MCMFFRITAGSIVLSTLLVAAPAREVTYATDVAPILYQHCTGCHHPNDIAPMSLMSYTEARPWAASIREAVVSRVMPPWGANPHYGKFSNDLRLSDAEIETIRLWTTQGAKQGDPAKTPAAPKYTDGWKIGTPDAIIDIGETQTVSSGGPDEYLYFTVPTHFTEDRWVQAAELRPGNRRVVHHAHVWVEQPKPPTAVTSAPAPAAAKTEKVKLTFVEGKLTHLKPDAPILDNGCVADDGAIFPGNPPKGGTGPLASYLPGKTPDTYPADTAKLIPAGATLKFQVHYSKTTGKDETDRTSVGLIFAAHPPAHPMRRIDISNYLFLLPPGDANHEVSECHRFESSILLTSLTAHMHVRGKSMRFDVEYPDGRKETLLDVPQYKFNWQMTYHLAEPKLIPAGTRLIITAHFDNSANNPLNPDPTKVIRWGEPSKEEMMDGWVEYLDAAPTTTALRH